MEPIDDSIQFAFGMLVIIICRAAVFFAGAEQFAFPVRAAAPRGARPFLFPDAAE